MKDPVTVVSVTTQPDGSILCSPDPVVVSDPDTMLTFDLSSSTHSFRSRNAITVASGGTDFPFPSWTTKTDQCLLLDRVNTQGEFDYTLHLIENASGRAVRSDPKIRNEPS